jgi:hypothetical protein
MKRKALLLVLAGLGLLSLAGCAHYVITDPLSGKTYFTEDIDDTGDGSIQFVDAKTGKLVTLQSSEVKEIDRDDFNTNVFGGVDPD